MMSISKRVNLDIDKQGKIEKGGKTYSYDFIMFNGTVDYHYETDYICGEKRENIWLDGIIGTAYFCYDDNIIVSMDYTELPDNLQMKIEELAVGI